MSEINSSSIQRLTIGFIRFHFKDLYGSRSRSDDRNYSVRTISCFEAFPLKIHLKNNFLIKKTANCQCNTIFKKFEKFSVYITLARLIFGCILFN